MEQWMVSYNRKQWHFPSRGFIAIDLLFFLYIHATTITFELNKGVIELHLVAISPFITQKMIQSTEIDTAL